MTQADQGSPEHRLQAASFVLLRRGDEVLLQLRAPDCYMGGRWACGAAGHIEVGESAPQAACREAAEELGITIRPDDLAPLCAMHQTDGPGDEWAFFFYECRTWAGTPHIAEPDKATRLEWFALTALPQPAVPHEFAVLSALASGHVPPIMVFGYQ